MGLLLKEALRRLCAEAEWSYAVFWRAIECENSRHLLWEEGYYKSSRVSCLLNIPTMDPSSKLVEGCEVKQTSDYRTVAESRCQAEDRISLLVEKIMKPLVHIVGYGIVGCAAFTGNHHWILQSGHNGESQTEVVAELNDQFLAGVQTVAVIPVLPHGVIQLGSIQRIIENIQFVNYAKILLAQLSGVPGFMSGHAMQSSTLLGLNVSGGHAEERCAKIDRSTAFIAKYGNIQNSNAPVPKPIKQPCSSSLETYQNIPGVTEVLLMSKSMNEPIATSHNGFKRPHLMLQPGDAEQFSNSGASIEQSVCFDSICGNPDQPSTLNSELASSGLEPLGWHLSSFRAKKSSSSKFTSQYDEYFHSDSQGPIFTYCNDNSASSSFLGKRESPSNSPDQWKTGCLTCSMNTENLYDVYRMNSSHAATSRILNDTDFVDNSCLLPRDVTSISDVNNANLADSVPEKQKHEVDLPRVINKPCHSSSECFANSEIKIFQPMSNIDHSRGSQNCRTDDSDPQGMPTRKKMNNGNCSVFNVNKNISSVNARRFPGNDLFEALGADFIPSFPTGKLDEFLDGHAWETSTDTSTSLIEPSASSIFDPTHSEFLCNDFLSDTEQDQLLDAIVSKISSAATQSSDYNLSCKTTISKTGKSAADINPSKIGQLVPPGKMQWDSLGLSSSCDAETAVSVSVRSSCSMENIGDCSITDGQNKSQISLWVESTQCMKNDSSSSSHCKKSDETGKSNRKRPKSGESPRPRPKDRQMIQDRVKELREIVPNGAKCSIDALLERTIKHMLFLQSVTKHADKLKGAGEPKILSEGGLLMKDNFEGGATWAFEVGSQSMICPIIVEDLNPPRQLLVEMLCEDRGFFLEIADLIKGLGFSILKGVMESRNSKIWARFAIEANKDATRMDIFLSLVRLLEPSALTSVTPQDISRMNLTQNIVATGMTDKLIQ